ncbi:hypothetical protein HOF78_01815 [Candidatus Woesearchaeota archaeon]|jgi:hypothetical protein|nr:hypothetical protein [Candidatus Woesearchaeota archaeon]
MKKYSSGLEIKKKIVNALQKGPISLRKLETKLNIGYNTLKRHSEELEYFKIIKIEKTKEGSKNGRAYLLISLN